MTAKFPTPGELFEETYRIEAILGSGGFARVYRAVEIGLNRPVALKILRPMTTSAQSESQRDNYLETLMERFQREAFMLSRLRSSFTVNLYKYGKTDDGLLYMALEYIDGLSLAEILRAGKPLPPERAVKVLQQVLMSLQEAHMMGMLHRDLKPANIMVYEHLGQRDQVKLLDFGIAKLVTDSGAEHEKDLTGDGTLIGTPRYMSPEQIQGTQIGPPADIYALGLVAFEMLTGERAIAGDSSIQIIGKQLAPQSFMLPEGDGVPAGLRYVINKMMEKDLAFRYETCDAVVLDLSRSTLLTAAEDLDIPDIDGLIETIDFEEDEDQSIEHALAALKGQDEPFESFETFDAPPATSKRGIVIGVVVAVLLLAGGYALSRPGEVEPPPVPKTAKAPEPVQQQIAPKVEPEIRVTAKLDGADIDGVTILVDGVDKGVTPLTLKAREIRDSRVLARYKMPDRAETVENAQEVTDPRDVMFEFDKVVSELIRPAQQRPLVKPPEPVVEKPPPIKKDRPPRPKPPVKEKEKNVYAAPE